MITLESIRGFFPKELQTPPFAKHLLKEYVECMALDWIMRSEWAGKLVFIGGTNLRLLKDIDRFSEDLDFDCKNLSPDEFKAFTDGLVTHLVRNGLPAIAKERESDKLTAMRRSILFPGLLKELGLSAFKEERFLMKVETQDQGQAYEPAQGMVRKCGYFFPVNVPPEPVLCAMKLSALLTRAKGRDFYDAMFLLQRTEPDYGFLGHSHAGIQDKATLKRSLQEKVVSVNLELKRRDVEHLLFSHERSSLVMEFPRFVESL